MDNLSLNTHDYDGKWLENYIKIKNSYKDKDIMSFDETITDIEKELSNFCGKIKDNLLVQFNSYHPHIIRCITLLKSKQGNNDSANKVSVEDILPYVWTNIKQFDPDGQFVFYEQLSDIITSGSCPQGRTTRLFQLMDLITC